jgi:hypothetical protein
MRVLNAQDKPNFNAIANPRRYELQCADEHACRYAQGDVVHSTGNNERDVHGDGTVRRMRNTRCGRAHLTGTGAGRVHLGSLVPIFLVLAIDCPWWKCKLPPFILCGCCLFIVVHSEYDGFILDTVDLAFARSTLLNVGSVRYRRQGGTTTIIYCAQRHWASCICH